MSVWEALTVRYSLDIYLQLFNKKCLDYRRHIETRDANVVIGIWVELRAILDENV